MLQVVHSAALTGLEAYRVVVEVAITRGTPMIQVVGLAESAVREGRDRIRAATKHLGYPVPGLRITVNLAPADVRKSGSTLDLPITVGILAAAKKVPGSQAARWGMVGELGLDGKLRPLRGALPVALHFRAEGDLEGLILPAPNLAEARPAADAAPGEGGSRRSSTNGDGRGFRVVGASGLDEVVDFLRGKRELPGPSDVPPLPAAGKEGWRDLSEVRGQETAKRTLEIAAAGGHNLLLTGEPGSGKTMLARRLPGILPPLTPEEAVEATAIHSVAGQLPPGAGLIAVPPFRAPHHTISEAGLVGGGSVPRPGEVSLAHRGVLFLDELPEFRRRALEVLRQPVEEGKVTLVRVKAAATFPAGFTLVAAMNPCPCGFYGAADPERCTCQPPQIARYLKRVSGPLLDRVDLRVTVRAVKWRELKAATSGEGSARVRERVAAARARAVRRLGARRSSGRRGSGGGRGNGSQVLLSRDGATPRMNAEMSLREVREHCAVDGAGEAMLRAAVEERGLTARGYHRVLKVARTVADLEGAEDIARGHVAEALRYRMPEDGGELRQGSFLYG